MPFIPVANTVLAEIRMTADLQQVENTLYFEFPAAPTLASMQTLADDLQAWWIASYAGQIWSGVELREITLTDLTSSSGPQLTQVPPSGTLGDLSNPPLPTSVTLTVSFRTALRGRSFRGRNYVVGLVESQTTSANEIDSTTIAAWASTYTDLFAVAADAGVTWVVVSRFSGVDGSGNPIPRAAGVTTPVTTVVIVDNVVDSQRRRLPGRGN